MFAAHLCGGAAGASISLPSASLFDTQVSPATARALYRIDSDGFVYEIMGPGAGNNIGQWCNPTTDVGDYEVRATGLSGTINTGTFGSWLALSSSHEWGNVVATNTLVVGQFLLEIRDIATSTVRATATVDAEADRTP